MESQAGRQEQPPRTQSWKQRRTRPPNNAATLGDLERIAFEYVEDLEAARELMRDVVRRWPGKLPDVQDDPEAFADLEREVRSAGSMLVFERAYEGRQEAWLRYARFLVGRSSDLAEDVLEEAIVATLAASPNFTCVKPVHTYVRMAISSVAGRLLTRHTEVPLDAVERAGELLGLRATEPSPERRAIRSERIRRLERAFQESPKLEREAYELRYLVAPSWKVQNIAKKQGVTRRTVTNRLATMRQRLLECLKVT